MFWIDDRWKKWVFSSPPIEIGGYKMIDVIGSQRFMILVRDEILSEKSVLKFPERRRNRFQIQNHFVSFIQS